MDKVCPAAPRSGKRGDAESAGGPVQINLFTPACGYAKISYRESRPQPERPGG